MITPFFGEFLLHPAPVEVSGVTCSHSCAYCFSNIRRAERESQCRSFVNLIQKRFQKDTLVSDLIKNGYAICVSNRTDPFSKSNKADTKTILSHIIQTDCGIFFQTKGGEEFYNYCDFLGASGKQNIVSYFTITSNNNDVTKRIEPGAPLFKERLNQIKYAVRSGHLVIVAFNPIVPQWMSAEQHNEIYSQMRDVGVNHFIYQRYI
jgi:DNA repair photolyase